MSLAAIRTAIADQINAADPGLTVYAYRPTAPEFPCAIIKPATRTKRRTAGGGERIGLVVTIYVTTTDTAEAGGAELDGFTDTVPALLEAVTGAGIHEIIAPTVTAWRDAELDVEQTTIQLLAADIAVSITTT